jgi:dolichol-phosphate mannosyltransferase
MSNPSSPASAPTRVAVVVPTLNEVENIDELLTAVLAQSGPALSLEVIVVDDGSKDGTQERVREWEARAPVRLLVRDATDGLIGAVVEGSRLATTEIVVVMDADLSHPPKRIPDLVQPILDGEKDMVIGSRYVAGGATPGWPMRRRFISRVASALAWPLTDVHDSLSGFFAVRRESVLAVETDAAGFKIALEILVRGGESLRVAEVPIAFVDRTRGTSKMSAGIILTYLLRLLAFSGAGPAATRAARVRWIDAVEFITDFIVFMLMLSAGALLGTAHIVSFVVASAVSYTLKAPRRLAPVPSRNPWAWRGRWLLVRVLALLLRGGVLGLLVTVWEWPPACGILFAIATSAAVNFAGSVTFVSPAVPLYGRGVGWRLATLGLTGYLVFLRLVYLRLPNLMPEETYYWNYGQHLAPGYLDHPPMVAWLGRLGTTLLGHNEFGVRVGAFVCWFIASLFCFGLARRMFGKTTGFVTVLLFQTLPFFFSLGLILTPDAPLVACWTAMLFYLYRALVEDKPAAWWGVGAALGFGMLSKYSIALLGLATVCFLVLDARSRKWFFSPRPYLAVALAVVIFSPVIYWNATHDWASFAFQSSRRLAEKPQFALHILLASVFGLLAPTGAVAGAIAIWTSWARARGIRADPVGARPWLFAVLYALVPLSVFVFFSLRHRPQFNWTGPSWLAVLPVIALGITAVAPQALAGWLGTMRRSWVPTLVTLTLIYGAGLHYLSLGLPNVGYSSRMELLPVGWDDMAHQLGLIEKNAAKSAGSLPLFVGMDRYFISSELAFYVDQTSFERVAGLDLFGGLGLMYGYWSPPRAQIGKPLIIVAFREEDLERKVIKDRTSGLGPIQRGLITRDGSPVRPYFFRLARAYLGPAETGAAKATN